VFRAAGFVAAAFPAYLIYLETRRETVSVFRTGILAGAVLVSLASGRTDNRAVKIAALTGGLLLTVTALTYESPAEE